MNRRVLKLKSVDEMKDILLAHGKPLSDFKAGKKISVSNKMRKGYSYTLAVNPGTDMAPEFKPYATPAEMLAAGRKIFE